MSKTMQNPITDTEINAYLDQRMSESERQSFLQRLQQDQKAQQKLHAYEKNEQLLQNLYQPIAEQAIPDHLLKNIKTKRTNYTAIAATLLLFLFGNLFGWQANRFFNANLAPSLVENLVHPAAFAHAVYSVEKVHPVEVPSERKQHMDHWLSKRLKTQLTAPDLNHYDYQLVGGRLLPSTQERMAAQYMYQNEQGERITLYVRRGNWDAETAISFAQKNIHQKNYALSYWLDSDMGYVLAGQLDKNQAERLSKAVYQQMSMRPHRVVAKR